MQRRNVRVSVLEKICDAITPITSRITRCLLFHFFIIIIIIILLLFSFV